MDASNQKSYKKSAKKQQISFFCVSQIVVLQLFFKYFFDVSMFLLPAGKVYGHEPIRDISSSKPLLQGSVDVTCTKLNNGSLTLAPIFFFIILVCFSVIYQSKPRSSTQERICSDSACYCIKLFCISPLNF